MAQSAHPDNNIYHLGPFTIHLRESVVSANGETVAVSPRTMQVLRCLIDAGTGNVSRDEFITRVWNDNYVVGDHGLRDAIWELRKAFSDDPKAPTYIQTIPRKGYRLLIEPKPHPAAPWRREWVMTLARSMLAVGVVAVILLFNLDDETPVPADDWFGPAPVISGNRQSAAVIRSSQGQSDLYIIPGQFDNLGLTLKDSPGSMPAQVMQITNSDGDKISPVWAPNHADLAFIEYQRSDDRCRVKVYWSDRHQLQTVAEDCYVVNSPIGQLPSQLSWSADGSHLAYQSRRGDKASVIAVINLYRDDDQSITIGAGNQIAAFPNFSAENRLAYLQLNDPMMGYAQVVLLDTDGHLELSCVAMPVWGLAWADQRHLALTVSMNNPFDLWLLDTVTARVAATGTGGRYLSSRRIDDELIVDRFNFSSPLHITSVISESPPETLQTGGAPTAVDYSPVRGDLLITELDNAGMRHIVLVSASAERRTLFSARAIYNPRFNREGTAIGFTSRGSTRENAISYRLDIDSGRISALSDESHVLFFAEWAADGEGWYGLSGIPSPLRHSAMLMRIGREGKPTETLAAGVSLTVVLDQKGVLWWSDDAGVVYRRSPLTNEDVAVTWLNSVYESWTIDSQGETLYYTETGLDGTDIMALNTASGDASVIRSLASLVGPIVGLTLARDGTLVYRPGTHSWHDRESTSVADLLSGVDDDAWLGSFCRLNETNRQTAF